MVTLKQSGISKAMFVSYIERLRYQLRNVQTSSKSNIPFLIVIPERFVPPAKQMSFVKLLTKEGVFHVGLDAYRNSEGIDDISLPYLIFDVDPGDALVGAHPYDAVQQLARH